MKGDLQTWEEFLSQFMGQLERDIKTHEEGNDAYKRWPVHTLKTAQVYIKVLQEELDKDHYRTTRA